MHKTTTHDSNVHPLLTPTAEYGCPPCEVGVGGANHQGKDVVRTSVGWPGPGPTTPVAQERALSTNREPLRATHGTRYRGEGGNESALAPEPNGAVVPYQAGTSPPIENPPQATDRVRSFVPNYIIKMPRDLQHYPLCIVMQEVPPPGPTAAPAPASSGERASGQGRSVHSQCAPYVPSPPTHTPSNRVGGGGES